MSAFLVDKTCIDKVCAAFEARDKKPAEAYDQLGARLWLMNLRAVETRYPKDGHDEALAAQLRQYRFTAWGHYSDVERLKGAECLEYQCTEGNVESEPLYKELEKLQADLCSKIVHDLPEYQIAKWG